MTELTRARIEEIRTTAPRMTEGEIAALCDLATKALDQADALPPDLAAIAARNAARTQGKWLGMNMVNIDGSSMTAENIGEYIKNSVKKTAEVQKVERFLFVTIDGDNQPDICHVGNGPMGPHNAAFIAHASEDIPSLLAEVARLTAEKQEAEQRGYDAAKEQAARIIDNLVAHLNLEQFLLVLRDKEKAAEISQAVITILESEAAAILAMVRP